VQSGIAAQEDLAILNPGGTLVSKVCTKNQAIFHRYVRFGCRLGNGKNSRLPFPLGFAL